MLKKKQKPDYSILIIVFILIVFGLVCLSSASIVMANSLGDPYYFFKHQLFNGVSIGLILMFVLSKTSYNKLKKFALPLILFSIFLLIIIFVPGIGSTQGTTAQRWIKIGGFSFQPSEFVKLSFIIYIAAWLDQRGESIKGFKTGFIPFLIITGIISILILMQPNASTTGLILMTSVAVFFMAGARLYHLFILFTMGSFFGFFILRQASYRLNRLKVFLDPSLDPQGIGYQLNQALLAIGSGGLWGLGLGHSRQKYNYLPEILGDSIFAIIAEELGFLGVIFVLSLFVLLAYRGMKIVQNAEDKFGACLAMGITFWLVSQGFINIASISGLIPLTGVPLPFISYGSSCLIMSMAGAGILYSVSKGKNI